MAQHLHTNTGSDGWLETLKSVAKLMVELRKLAWVVALAIFVGIALWNNSSDSAEMIPDTCPAGLTLVAWNEELQDYIPVEEAPTDEVWFCGIYSPSNDGGPSYADPGEPWTPPSETDLAGAVRTRVQPQLIGFADDLVPCRDCY